MTDAVGMGTYEIPHPFPTCDRCGDGRQFIRRLCRGKLLCDRCFAERADVEPLRARPLDPEGHELPGISSGFDPAGWFRQYQGGFGADLLNRDIRPSPDCVFRQTVDELMASVNEGAGG